MQQQLRLPNKQGTRPGRRTGVSARAGPHRPVSVQCTASAQPDQPECSTSGSQQQRSELPRQFWSLSASQRVKLLSGLSAAAVFVPSVGGFNGGPPGGNGDGGGGGGGGGSGGWFSSVQQLFDLAKEESEDESSEAQDGKRKKNPWAKLITDSEELEGGSPTERAGTNRCVEIVIEGWPSIGNLPSQEELRDMLTVQEGHIFAKQDIVEDRRRLEMQYEDYIAGVEVYSEFVDEKSNHQRVVYKFTPHQFRGINRIDIKGAALMPPSVMEGIIAECTPDNPYMVDIALMDKVRNKVEKWYQSHGLPFCYVGFFDGMEDGVLRANVTEAKIDAVAVKYVRPKLTDNSELEFSVYDEGRVVAADEIIKLANFQKGNHYQVEDGYDAMNSIFACGLLEDIHIEPEQDPTDVNKINVKIRVEEVQPKTLEMDLDWAFQMKGGVPLLSRQSLIPGGSVEISHENLFGNSESATLSLSSGDWRNPAADLGFSLAYTEPFFAPRTTRNVQVFNTRKTSTVFTPGGEKEVPPVFVDRFGAKGWLSKVCGQDNKVEHALSLQVISTMDENGQVVAKGGKVARGYMADNGPQTTLSGDGRDLSLSYQGFVVLDDVRFINGNQIGKRAIFQLDQGLNPPKIPLPGGKAFGLSGGLYNRLQASFTKFMELPFLPKKSPKELWVERKAPNTLVLHAKVGNILGDVGAYDYFSLGGPYSVRGYNYGEIGAARRYAEVSAEVRLPLKNVAEALPGTLYSFVDYASDLGSGKELTGNPTEYYRKPGRGLSYGVGVKALGACRVEYARDCNSGTGTVLVNFGERY